MKTKSLIAGLVISLALAGNASAEGLATMDGIPAEAMSHSEMDKVEGKNYQLPFALLNLPYFQGVPNQPWYTYQVPTAQWGYQYYPSNNYPAADSRNFGSLMSGFGYNFPGYY